jgi:hypothetical protein
MTHLVSFDVTLRVSVGAQGSDADVRRVHRKESVVPASRTVAFDGPLLRTLPVEISRSRVSNTKTCTSRNRPDPRQAAVGAGRSRTPFRQFEPFAVDRDLGLLLDEVVPRGGVSHDTSPLVAHREPKTSQSNMVQPLTKVRVRHHQVDQPTVLGTQYTRDTQGAGLTGADGALGLRLCPGLNHVDSSETAFVPWRPRMWAPHAQC